MREYLVVDTFGASSLRSLASPSVRGVALTPSVQLSTMAQLVDPGATLAPTLGETANPPVRIVLYLRAECFASGSTPDTRTPCWTDIARTGVLVRSSNVHPRYWFAGDGPGTIALPIASL